MKYGRYRKMKNRKKIRKMKMNVSRVTQFSILVTKWHGNDVTEELMSLQSGPTNNLTNQFHCHMIINNISVNVVRNCTCTKETLRYTGKTFNNKEHIYIPTVIDSYLPPPPFSTSHFLVIPRISHFSHYDVAWRIS